MITGLTVLDSSYVGSRDLWWVDDPLATVGYNIYRAFDVPENWQRLNTSPITGNFYRDISTLQQVSYTVQDYDWIEKGELGSRYSFRIPDLPYAIINQGRPVISNSPDDVTVYLNGNPFRPKSVAGVEQRVTILSDETLPVGGAVSNYSVEGHAPITTVSVVYKKLINFVDIYQSQMRTFYTVTSIGAQGEVEPLGTLDLPYVNSQEVDRMDYMQKEMVRRNAWLFEQVGEPASLMLKKSRGTHCGCAGPGEQARTSCPACFGTAWVGGYFGPFDFLFIDPDTALQITLDEGGRKVDRASRSFLGRTPLVQAGDMIVRRNGERLVIAAVTYKSPRGVLLQQEFDVQLLPQGDTRYLIPITNNPMPVIYDPQKVKDPNDGIGGGQPITRAENDPPLKLWENPDPQIGRTVTFANIQH